MLALARHVQRRSGFRLLPTEASEVRRPPNGFGGFRLHDHSEHIASSPECR